MITKTVFKRKSFTKLMNFTTLDLQEIFNVTAKDCFFLINMYLSTNSTSNKLFYPQHVVNNCI